MVRARARARASGQMHPGLSVQPVSAAAWINIPLGEIRQPSDRINYQTAQPRRGYRADVKMDPATPKKLTSFGDENALSGQYRSLHSSEAAARPADSWDSYITDPELDVLKSPSLPKNFVPPSTAATPSPASIRTRTRPASDFSTPIHQPKKSTDLLDDGKQQTFNLHEARSPFVLTDLGSDPFTDSASESCASDDSDATVTPVSFSSSVTAHNVQSLLGTPEARKLKDLLSRQPAARQLIPGLVSAQLDFLEDSDPYVSDEEPCMPEAYAEMAPNFAAKNGAAEPQAVSAGPHLGTIKVGRQFILESAIRRTLEDKRLDAAREANYRLQGVQVIETTREALLLPVKTFNAACSFYHRFRLEHPTPDYNHTEAALASLFVACKVEDTLKKSREILCAHHNLKNPDHQTTQDDKIFDAPSKTIIGLERFIVEAINFDFRVRYPQKVLAKIIKKVLGRNGIVSSFFVVAFKMSIDMYKTFAPLKHSSVTCAIVIAQLTSSITDTAVEEFQALDPRDWHTDEQSVTEVMLDLLDLYTQHGKATKVGPMYDLQDFIDIQITVNRQMDRSALPRYTKQCRDCDAVPSALTPSTGSPTSLNTPSATGTSNAKRGPKAQEGGTTRFIFDAEQAASERQAYDEYTKDSWEEWEEEVEEPVADRRDDRRHEPRGPRGPRGHGHGRGHGRGGFDPGWTPRNRHERRRRGGGFY